jgi:hypothetical protein
MAIAHPEFWGTNYYRHPPLSAAMVQETERALGVRLPSELIALLRIQNGGYTKGFAHPMEVRTTWAEDHVPLQDLFGIVTDESIQSPLNLLATPHTVEEWGLPPKQVLLSGDGHWWITLDYRAGDAPKIVWIDVECGEDVEIAPSFQAFLDGLVPQSVYAGENEA